MANNNERTHLCPHCNCVEMVFVERIVSDKTFRMRRFKCPVCDLTEMYTCGGPDDAERVDRAQRIKKLERINAHLPEHVKLKMVDL